LITSCSSHVLWNLKTFVCIFLCMTLLVSIMLGNGLIVHDNLINNKSIHTTWASCYYALPMMVKWWKKLEIKFYLNENIEWHCKQLELNSTLVDFNLNSIELNNGHWGLHMACILQVVLGKIITIPTFGDQYLFSFFESYKKCSKITWIREKLHKIDST
jgi:hypothetical protein